MSILNNVDDIIQVRLNFGHGDGWAYNIMHYQVAARSGALSGVYSVLSEIAEAMVDKWGPLWAPGASDEVSLHGASVQNVFPAPRSKLVTFTSVAPTDGAIASQALPLQDSPTLVKDTDYGERWGIGRMFYVGVPESMAQNGQVIVGATRTALEAMANALDDNVVVTTGEWSLTLQPVLYHAATVATAEKPATATRITRVVGGRLSDPLLKSMRTRRPGKGI